MDDRVVTKSAFAAIAGVSGARVSQYLSDGKISGEAIVGVGLRSKIRVDVALAQLRQQLDPVRSLGADGVAAHVDAAHADTVGASTVEAGIKAERLRQLELSNQRAEAEAAVRAGRYVLASDAKQEMGRAASRLLAVFKSALGEFAGAMLADPPKTQRDALRTLRTTWRAVRVRAAKAKGEEAAAVALLVEEGGEDAVG